MQGIPPETGFGWHTLKALPSCETLQCLTGEIDNNNNNLTRIYPITAPLGWPTECGAWLESRWPAGSVQRGVSFFFDLKFNSVIPCLILIGLGDTPSRLAFLWNPPCLTGKIDDNNNNLECFYSVQNKTGDIDVQPPL